MKQRSRTRSEAPLRPRMLLSLFVDNGGADPDAPLSATELLAHPDADSLLAIYNTHCRALSHDMFMALLIAGARYVGDWDKVQERLEMPVPLPLRQALDGQLRLRNVYCRTEGSAGCALLEVTTPSLFIPCLLDFEVDDGALFGLPEHNRRSASTAARRLSQWLAEAVRNS